MNGFIIRTKDNTTIRFNYYTTAAPLTSAAFEATLPFSRFFLHARVSGQEIWIEDAPKLAIVQENASVFATAGEIVIGPVNPARNKTAGFMGIFYGEGKLVDCCNIFAKVAEEDLPALQSLGDAIWRGGMQELVFDKMQ